MLLNTHQQAYEEEKIYTSQATSGMRVCVCLRWYKRWFLVRCELVKGIGSLAGYLAGTLPAEKREREREREREARRSVNGGRRRGQLAS